MSLVGILATVYLAACALLFASQRSLLYFPQELPAEAEAHIQTLEVEGATLNLSARVIDAPGAIIYFGGNGDDVSSELAPFSAAFPSHALYLVHYRGYGGSSGEPSEQALHADAEFIYETVRARHPSVTVIGRSLGSGVATRLAREKAIDRLVLITPYDSVAAVAKRRFPIFPVKLLLRDRYDSLVHAPHINVPTLVIKAETDQVVPHAHTDTLITAIDPAIVRTVTIPGTTHNSIWDSQSSFATLDRFLDGN